MSQQLPHSVFLPLGANFRDGSKIDWLKKSVLMPNAAVPYGFGKRLRLLTPDNFERLSRLDVSTPSSTFAEAVALYECDRCRRAASEDNSVYTNPDQPGMDLCVGCVAQRAKDEANEPREVFSVSWNPMD